MAATLAPLVAAFAGCGTLHQIKVASHHWFNNGHVQVAQVCAEPLEPVCHGYEQTTWRPMHDCEPVTAYNMSDQMPLEAEPMPMEQAPAPMDQSPAAAEPLPEAEDPGVATPLPAAPAEPAEPAMPAEPPVAPAPITPAPAQDPSSVVVPPADAPAATPAAAEPAVPDVPATPLFPPAEPAEVAPAPQTPAPAVVPDPADQSRRNGRSNAAEEQSDFFRMRNRSYTLQPTTISSATAAFALFNELSRALPLNEPEEESDLDVPTPAEDHSIPMAKFISVD